VGAQSRTKTLRGTTETCPNCDHLQHTADRRWVELQSLRARLMGYENVLSEYVLLVSETAASELDPEAWNARLQEARERALSLLPADLRPPTTTLGPLSAQTAAS
jgi:hypothetical protein